LSDNKFCSVDIIPDFSIIQFYRTGIAGVALAVHSKGKLGQDIDAGSCTGSLLFDNKAMSEQVSKHFICFVLICIVKNPY